jgi:hypothetical protein
MGSPARPSGTSDPKVATRRREKVDAINGVQMGPGATAFTRIRFFASAWASDWVKETIAPFVAA